MTLVNRTYFYLGSVLLFAPLLGAKTLSGRYIVELNTEPVAEHVARLSRRPALHGAAATAHRTRLRAEQQTLRTQIELRQAKVLDTVDTVANAMFVQIPDEQAAQLASLPGVKRVTPVRMMHMVLDRAVLLHKVADAWNQIGADRAGLGVKIAIIDSGIDFSPLPANSLSGAVALILRGTCTFEIKVGNAQRAGAVAALVYAAQDSPDPWPPSPVSLQRPGSATTKSSARRVITTARRTTRS